MSALFDTSVYIAPGAQSALLEPDGAYLELDKGSYTTTVQLRPPRPVQMPGQLPMEDSMETCETCKDDACAYAGEARPQCDDYTAAPIPEPPTPPTMEEYEALLAQRDDLLQLCRSQELVIEMYQTAVSRIREACSVEVKR